VVSAAELDAHLNGLLDAMAIRPDERPNQRQCRAGDVCCAGSTLALWFFAVFDSGSSLVRLPCHGLPGDTWFALRKIGSLPQLCTTNAPTRRLG
jgi:hypothetical protein